jgi:pyrrolidone-carboxylate peptidase
VASQILNTSGFSKLLNPFLFALQGARTLAAASGVVTAQGESLWKRGTARAQAATSDFDDRPLYWERLEMTRAIRQWQPTAFSLSASDRTMLIDTFEKASRGLTTASFSGVGEKVKRILISGFDPFGFTAGETRAGNPSGAAVLSLDGQSVSSKSNTGRVEGVIFPVRYADFDAGTIESSFRPFLASTPPVDMIMTISQGGSTSFEIEQFAGRNRGAFSDNLNQKAPGTPAVAGVAGGPLAPPSSMPAGAQFTKTTLPGAEISNATFTTARDTIVKTAKQIIEAALPAI